MISRIYHPDKHIEEDKKRQAELMFAKLKTAYEVIVTCKIHVRLHMYVAHKLILKELLFRLPRF